MDENKKIANHSEYGLIKTLCIKTAENAFISNNNLSDNWKKHNYINKPNYSNSIEEYRVFEQHLKQTGAKILYLPQDDSASIDSIYCRDASIATDKGMIICNMGKELRKNEPSLEEKFFLKNNIPILGRIEYPGTVEGGDVAWLNSNLLAVGHSYRTNIEGIEQLESLLNPIGVEIIVADLPHFNGPSDVFHLMSILSPVDKDLAVVYSPLMPIGLRKLLIDMGYELIEVPDKEFYSMGCNVLALSPRKCLMLEGNPVTKMGLINAGAEVIEYKGDDISIKGGGGPTCLTRPIERI